MTTSTCPVMHQHLGSVLWITIDRPLVRNAINEDVVAGIAEGLRRAESTSSVRAVVLTGAGERAFCAGADLQPGSDIFDFDFSAPTTSYSRLLRQE